MRTLSKSKLIAFRQCPRRLWLEVHRKELLVLSDSAQVSLQIGHQVGDLARRLYDPSSKGVLIDAQKDGYAMAFEQSQALLQSSRPIFEAGFSIDGALSFADVLLPVGRGSRRGWRMVEVKSSSSVKDYHLDDIAIQAYIARGAGVNLKQVALATIDTTWVYPGDNAYEGLFSETDVTEHTLASAQDVQSWVADAHKVVDRRTMPRSTTGKQCNDPYPCGFQAHCQELEPQAEYPVRWLPRPGPKLSATLDEQGIIDLRDVPDGLLNPLQTRVKQSTLWGKRFFDAKAAIAALAGYTFPAYFLDFETVQLAVPVWKGTRPYQQIPFQFSVHRLSQHNTLTHDGFLDLSGKDPSRSFARALIEQCGSKGPVFVYNRGFESGRIKELAERFPTFRKDLLAINERLVDLLPIARDHFYHPSQEGSWSIKKVLPVIAPDLSYESLEGVKDGGMAMDAYKEAIHPDTTPARKAQIQEQLIRYCELDTFAMVRLWAFFVGRRTFAGN